MSYRTCLVPDCATDMSGKYLRKGYCERHYYNWRKYGTPAPTAEQKKSTRKTRAKVQGKYFSHECAVCHDSFESLSRMAKYCSDKCRNISVAIRSGNTCAVCNAPMWNNAQHIRGVSTCLECRKKGLAPVTAKHGTVYRYELGCKCADCAGAKREANMAYKARVKAEHGVNPSTIFKRRYRERTGLRYRMAPSDWIDPKVRVEIYERDGWLCHLCNEPVERAAHFNDDLAPSLDHLKPRSKGGSDDPDNLATSHRLCNSRRRDDELEALEVV